MSTDPGQIVLASSSEFWDHGVVVETCKREANWVLSACAVLSISSRQLPQKITQTKVSSMLSKNVVPLPPNGERLAGESVDNKENYSLQVSNADGYLCRLQATCHFPVAPATVYAIFVNTGNLYFH